MPNLGVTQEKVNKAVMKLHNCKAGGSNNRVVELWWRSNDRLLDGALAESVEEKWLRKSSA